MIRKQFGILVLVLGGLLALLPDRGSASTILLYYSTQDTQSTNVGVNIRNALQLAGHTVTAVVAGVGYCPTADVWGAYDEVWDARFNNLQSTVSGGCPAPDAGGNDNFSLCWRNKAKTYLSNCGKLWMLGENRGFWTRNQGNYQFYSDLGLLAYCGGNFDDSLWPFQHQNDPSGPAAGVVPPGVSTLPGSPGWFSEYEGGIPTAYYSGTVFLTRTLGWTNINSPPDPPNVTRAVQFGATAAQLGALGVPLCQRGAFVSTMDASHMFDYNYVTGNPTYIGYSKDTYAAIATWLGGNTCSCGTPSFTPTRTVTRTDTPSVTPSDTRSVTPTDTQTDTPSDTPTSTQTFTVTATRTATPTFSSTSSMTMTRTSTATPSDTSSVTSSATETQTRTVTPSSTDTVSSSATSSQTPTRTVTPSRTVTPTQTITSYDTATNTWTVTPTYTWTLSSTPTPSCTDTPTDTSTRTQTPTDSPSPTSTDTITLGPTPSDTVTLTITPTVTPTFTPTDTRTETSVNSPTDTPTVTFTLTVTLTRTPTPSTTVTPSDTPTASSTLSRTVTLTITLTATLRPTPIPQPMHVTVGLYNSAGERVRLLFDGSAQYIVPDLGLSSALLVTGQVPVSLNLEGATYSGTGTMSWDGTNDSGQSVASGAYYFKIESEDSLGTVSAQIKSIQVLDVQGENRLEVFNSAGERVYHRELGSAYNGVGGMRLDQDSMLTGGEDDLKVILSQGSTETQVGWDGRNDQGVPVASGVYTLQWVHTNAGGAREVQSKSFTVLRAPDTGLPGGDFKVAPNPVRGDAAVEVFFDAAPGLQVHAKLYDVAGERVATDEVDGTRGHCSLGSGRLASGTYVIELEVKAGLALLRRDFRKVAILR